MGYNASVKSHRFFCYNYINNLSECQFYWIRVLYLRSVIVLNNQITTFMEIRVYLSMENWLKHKPCYSRKVEDLVNFDCVGLLYKSFKLLYGCNAIIEFVCV